MASFDMPEIVDEADLLLPSTDVQGLEPNPQLPADFGAPPGHKPALLREAASGSAPARPLLRRDSSVPAPRQPPPLPPPAIPQSNQTLIPPLPSVQHTTATSTDPLDLQQINQAVRDLPRTDVSPYAFVYRDASSLPDELEEWFSYGLEERARILKAQSSFAQEWGLYSGCTFVEDSSDTGSSLDWTTASPERRREFLTKLLEGLKESDLDKRLRYLEALVYLVLGCWHETACLPVPEDAGGLTACADSTYESSGLQIRWIRKNIKILFDCKGLQVVYDVVKTSCRRECSRESIRIDTTTIQREAEQRETWCALTIFYVALEVARTSGNDEERLLMRREFLGLQPNILVFLGDILNEIRWDDSIHLSVIKILCVMWKSILVCIGGLPEVEQAKNSFKDKMEEQSNDGKPIITASPLDYHAFRQEISSKYPAYKPPPPLFALEPDSKSILPPMKPHNSHPAVQEISAQPAQHGSSILRQPVHIATPAPSPPPSPAGGKGTKKQNYQTNQLFPFLYPPLDETSNLLGGKGSTNIQDSLAGRKWTGSDIPVSIKEATELFSTRMRAPRALKQLWDERVEFTRYERGWTAPDKNEDVSHLDLEDQSNEAKKANLGQEKKSDTHEWNGTVDDRLQVVEDYYRDGLPHLQSVVMVVLKTILANVAALVSQSNGQNGVQQGFNFQENQNGPPPQGAQNIGNNPQFDLANLNAEELDLIRNQEITAKASAGLLLIMLKWFKVSHVLKFEYLTQLLVDSNYIPMILKMLQIQEIDRLVNYKCDRQEWNFFQYCCPLSRNWTSDQQSSNAQEEDESDDEAAPPPVIKRKRDEPAPPTQDGSSPMHPAPPVPPEVDELGIPTTEIPLEPITTYSWRNFSSSINFLRVLQKVCKGKTHRNLMLVTYKSANYLKRTLKVPQLELRLYTLKLFKNQVPYCGRKWRQSNMRVITAVYLHCRPELRDDWLSASDVDSDVEHSIAMEQALRALTHWYNLRHYPKQMGTQPGVLADEQDFFLRELEKMNWVEAGMEDSVTMDPGWDPNMPVDAL